MFKSGLSHQEVDNAREGEIKNACLFLQKQSYEDSAFKTRKDFKFVIAKNLKSVSSHLFQDSAVQLAYMPEVESINDRAFKYCPLTAICFLKAKTVGAAAFSDCGQLSKVFLPACEELAYNCFSVCKSVKILDLSRVQTVGFEQFWGCNSLTDLLIPSTNEIGEDCFRFCDSLRSIYSKLDQNWFKCTEGCKEEKSCQICRGQLEECLRKGNDQLNSQKVLKELEEQKLLLLQEAGEEPVLNFKEETLSFENQNQNKLQIEREKLTEQAVTEQIQQSKIENRNDQMLKDQQIELLFGQDFDLKMEFEQKQENQDEQIKNLNDRITKLDKLNQQVSERLNLKIKELEHQQEQIVHSFDLKVERMVKQFENQKRENDELRRVIENFFKPYK